MSTDEKDPKDGPGKTVISVRMSNDLADRIKEAAKGRGLNTSQYCVDLIERFSGASRIESETPLFPAQATPHEGPTIAQIEEAMSRQLAAALITIFAMSGMTADAAFAAVKATYLDGRIQEEVEKP
jgi:hypothetical protein